MKTIQRSFLVFCFTAAWVISLTRCAGNKTEPAVAFFQNLNDTVDYVGIEKCRVCHEDHYNSFIKTGMGSSFGPANVLRSKGRFPANPVYDPKTDMYYVAWWNNNELRITEYRLQGKDTIHKRTETITHIIGSGHHTNSHFWMDNGYLYQAPLTFYTQSGKWDLPPGFEETNTRFSRKIDVECMACHNAMPQLEKGSLNKFTKIPAGIDCERCHGPGELHVLEKSRGILVDTRKQADRSIVNPARLPWKMQVDICQRCHLQGNNVLKPGKDFTDFKPGMKLSDVFDIFMPGKADNAFFMAGHAERLQLSACFKNSNKNDIEKYDPKLNFTCITCHNPHVSVRETNTQKFNNKCVSCHNYAGNSKLKNCSENPVRISQKKNNCVACHMPANNTGDIPHVTVHDHFIRKNYQTSSIAKNKEILYAVNDEKPDNNTEIQAYITWFEKFDTKSLYLKKAGELVKKKEPAPDILIHYWYANQAWNPMVQKAKELIPDSLDAWTNYRIGKAFDRVKDLGAALSWYQKASTLMPGNTDFAVEYGNALVRAKRFKEAAAVLDKIIAAQPKNDLAYTNAGAAAFGNHKIPEAVRYLKKAIALSPDNETAHLYLAEIYYQTGDNRKAIQALQQALRINPKNAEAQRLSMELKKQF